MIGNGKPRPQKAARANDAASSSIDLVPHERHCLHPRKPAAVRARESSRNSGQKNDGTTGLQDIGPRGARGDRAGPNRSRAWGGADLGGRGHTCRHRGYGAILQPIREPGRGQQYVTAAAGVLAERLHTGFRVAGTPFPRIRNVEVAVATKTKDQAGRRDSCRGGVQNERQPDECCPDDSGKTYATGGHRRLKQMTDIRRRIQSGRPGEASGLAGAARRPDAARGEAAGTSRPNRLCGGTRAARGILPPRPPPPP